MMKRLFSYIAVIALVMLPILPKNAFGQNGAISPTIGIKPAKIVENVVPGKGSTFQAKLRNYGQDPLPLTAAITGISDINESGVPVFSDTVSPRTAKDWIKIKNPDVIIAPGEEEIVEYTITPPAGTAPGGYHAAVIFQAKLPSYYFDLDASTRILPAISQLLFLTILSDKLPTVDDLKLESISVPKLVTSTPISLVSRVSNSSDFFIQTDAQVNVSGGLNRANKSESLGTIILLPDGSRKLISAFEGSFWPGIYTAQVNLKQGDKILVASAKFVAMPWQFTVGLVLGIFVILFMAFRRRFKHAYRVLIGKEPLHQPRKRQPTLR